MSTLIWVASKVAMATRVNRWYGIITWSFYA